MHKKWPPSIKVEPVKDHLKRGNSREIAMKKNPMCTVSAGRLLTLATRRVNIRTAFSGGNLPGVRPGLALIFGGSIEFVAPFRHVPKLGGRLIFFINCPVGNP
jgi:hypothetical protein